MRQGREGGTTFWLLKYTTIAKPAFRFEYTATCVLPTGGPAQQTLL